MNRGTKKNTHVSFNLVMFVSKLIYYVFVYWVCWKKVLYSVFNISKRVLILCCYQCYRLINYFRNLICIGIIYCIIVQDYFKEEINEEMR